MSNGEGGGRGGGLELGWLSASGGVTGRRCTHVRAIVPWMALCRVLCYIMQVSSLGPALGLLSALRQMQQQILSRRCTIEHVAGMLSTQAKEINVRSSRTSGSNVEAAEVNPLSHASIRDRRSSDRTGVRQTRCLSLTPNPPSRASWQTGTPPTDGRLGLDAASWRAWLNERSRLGTIRSPHPAPHNFRKLTGATATALRVAVSSAATKHGLRLQSHA